jgi:hypothetical protein
VEGDRDGLKQVLLILADNAGAHSAPGATIGISTNPVRMTVDRFSGQGFPFLRFHSASAQPRLRRRAH